MVRGIAGLLFLFTLLTGGNSTVSLNSSFCSPTRQLLRSAEPNTNHMSATAGESFFSGEEKDGADEFSAGVGHSAVTFCLPISYSSYVTSDIFRTPFNGFTSPLLI